MYGIPTLDVDQDGRPIPGRVILGYVGQTRQTVKQREEQHRESQSFGDVIVGGSWVIEEGFWTDAELDAREEHYIRNGAVLVPGTPPQRPRYNYTHNLDNPHRIEVWRAAEQRQTREPGWQPRTVRVPQQRRPRPRPVAPQPAGTGWAWTPARVRVACLAGAWSLITLPLWVWTARMPAPVWWDGLLMSAGVASLVVGRLLPRGSRSATRRRYRGRR